MLVAYDKEIAEGVRLARLGAAVGRDDAMALWSSGHALAYLAGELDVGMMLIDRACALNPNLAPAWTVAGWTHVYRGEPGPAIEKFDRSMRLSPLDPLLYICQSGIAFAHFLAEQYDEAVAWTERTLNEQPNWMTSARLKAAAYALAGRTEDARRAFAELQRVQPGMRLSEAREWMPPFRRPQDTERFLRGMREAGMPE